MAQRLQERGAFDRKLHDTARCWRMDAAPGRPPSRRDARRTGSRARSIARNGPCSSQTTFRSQANPAANAGGSALLDRNEQRMADLAFEMVGQVSLARRVLDQDHVAGGNE